MSVRDSHIVRYIKRRSTFNFLALQILRINPNEHKIGKNKKFDLENKSHIGDFYWWE
jgi:hypothetical protein